jgi:hypothetical protein
VTSWIGLRDGASRGKSSKRVERCGRKSLKTNNQKGGAPGEIRTPDPLVRRCAVQKSKCRFWCRLRGSASFISSLNWTELGPKFFASPVDCFLQCDSLAYTVSLSQLSGVRACALSPTLQTDSAVTRAQYVRHQGGDQHTTMTIKRASTAALAGVRQHRQRPRKRLRASRARPRPSPRPLNKMQAPTNQNFAPVNHGKPAIPAMSQVRGERTSPRIRCRVLLRRESLTGSRGSAPEEALGQTSQHEGAECQQQADPCPSQRQPRGKNGNRKDRDNGSSQGTLLVSTPTTLRLEANRAADKLSGPARERLSA